MSASPPDVQLLVGSSVALHVGARPARLSPLQQCYLLLLAAAGETGIRRDEVISLLWDAREDRTTRHRVRQLNYGLSRKADTAVVEARGSLLMLCDGIRVEWRPEPLAQGLQPPTPAFDDRISDVRDAQARSVARGSVRDLDSARLLDFPDEVLRVLDKGSPATGSWRDVLWALLRTGRVREAEFELRRVLGDDIAMEGLSAARRIATEPDRILSLAAAGGDPSLPLLGRDDDVRELSDLILSGSSCILVTGVRGVGRSRILGQAVATLLSNQDDVVVLGASGVAFERHVPFGGLGQLLNDELLIQAFGELGQPETEVIRRALPVQFESKESHVLAQLGGPGSYLRVARAVMELFQRAFGNAEVILAVDDLEHFDRSSVEVVTRLTSVSNSRLLATWCTEGQTAQNELLFRFQGTAPDLLPLRDLALRDAERLCRSVAPGLGDKEVEDVARLSGGRPGRIVELIRALQGSPILSGPLGPTLDELLRRRVRELPEIEQRVLVLLTANGGRLDVGTLGGILGTGILETAGHLRSLERSGLVRLEGSRAAVAPSLLTEFVQREIPPPIRRETHASIAAQLMQAPDRADPGSVAHHLMESGRPVEATAWFLRAGEAARDRTADAEAIVFFERGLSGQDQPDPDIAKGLGSLHAGMGDFRQSIHWYGRARIGYVDRGDRVGDVEAALASANSSLELHSDRNELIREVSTRLEEARSLGNAALIYQALDLWLNIADYGHDWAMLRKGQALLEKELSAHPSDPWIALAGTRFTYLGNPDRALSLARTAYLGLRGDAYSRPPALRRLIICLFTQMKPVGWRERALLAEADRLAFSTGDLYTRYSQLSNRALWAMDYGRWDEAESLFLAASRFVGGPDTVAARRLSVNRAIFEIRRGQTLDAVAHLQELERWIPTPQASMNSLYQACRLLVALERGKISDAQAIFESLGELDTSFPFSSDLAFVPLARAKFLRRTGRKAASRSLLEGAIVGFTGHNPAAAQRLKDALESDAETLGVGNLRPATEPIPHPY